MDQDSSGIVVTRTGHRYPVGLLRQLFEVCKLALAPTHPAVPLTATFAVVWLTVG